jgi:hypothetical protein
MLPVTDVRLEHNQDVKSGPINLQSAEWTLMSQSMRRRLTFPQTLDMKILGVSSALIAPQ